MYIVGPPSRMHFSHADAAKRALVAALFEHKPTARRILHYQTGRKPIATDGRCSKRGAPHVDKRVVGGRRRRLRKFLCGLVMFLDVQVRRFVKLRPWPG